MFGDSLSSLRTFWSAVIKSPTFFRSGHDCPSTSSARSPRYFRLQADIAIWVFRKVSEDTMLARPSSTFARDSIGNSWEKLEVPRCPGGPGFSRGSKGLLSTTKFSLNSCSQSSNSCNRSHCTSSCPSFLFLFSVSADARDGLSRDTSLTISLFSDAWFSVLTTESCDEGVEEVGVDYVEELGDKPGTTNGTEFDILQSIFLPFLVSCGFWPLVQW